MRAACMYLRPEEDHVTLPRPETTAGLSDELDRFAALLRSLDAAEWATPTRCVGWTAGDVAAHVVGQFSDVANGRFEGLGTPEVTARQVEERRGRSAAEVADELAQAAKVGRDIMAGL